MNLTGRPAKAPEKETEECPETELTCKMVFYNRKKYFKKRAQEELKHDKVYDPKRSQGH